MLYQHSSENNWQVSCAHCMAEPQTQILVLDKLLKKVLQECLSMKLEMLLGVLSVV